MICFGDNGEYEESADYEDDYTDKNYTSDDYEEEAAAESTPENEEGDAE